MTAPTTRETADHAELARLAEAKASWSLGIYKNREQANDAAKFNALDLPATVLSLLSEIAALRERLETARIAREAHNRQFTQAERQRDEAVGLLRKATGLKCDDWRGFASFKTNARALLANQGADQ